jgi:hypothetical protein
MIMWRKMGGLSIDTRKEVRDSNFLANKYEMLTCIEEYILPNDEVPTLA